MLTLKGRWGLPLAILLLAGCGGRYHRVGSPSPATIRSISISPTGSPVSTTNGQRQFAATATMSDDSTHDVTGEVAWATSDPAVATISASGMLTAVTNGDITVGASKGSVAATTVPVHAVPAVHLASLSTNLVGTLDDPYDFSDPSVPVEQIDVIGHYSDGSTQDLTTQAAKTSDAPLIVGITTTGMVRNGSGQTTVHYSYGGLNGTIVVRTAPARTLQSITLSPTNSILYWADPSVAFTATGHYSDGTTADVTLSAAWSSADPSIASVDSAGVGTAVTHGVGDTTFSATKDGVTGSVAVHVTD